MATTTSNNGRSDLVSGTNITTNLVLGGNVVSNPTSSSSSTSLSAATTTTVGSGTFQNFSSVLVVDSGTSNSGIVPTEIASCNLVTSNSMILTWQYQRIPAEALTIASKISFGELRLSMLVLDDGNLQVFGTKVDEGSEFFYNYNPTTKVFQLCWKCQTGQGKQKIITSVQYTTTISNFPGFKLNAAVIRITENLISDSPPMNGLAATVIPPVVYRKTINDQMVSILG